MKVFQIAISVFQKLQQKIEFKKNVFFYFYDFWGVLKVFFLEFNALLKNTTDYDKFYGENGLSISIIVFELYQIKKNIFFLKFLATLTGYNPKSYRLSIFLRQKTQKDKCIQIQYVQDFK